MDEKVMHFVWCADDNVQAPMLVAIGSALRSHRPNTIAIHVVSTGLSPDFVARLRVLCNRLGAASFEVTTVNADQLTGLQNTEWIPNGAYIRFLLDASFPYLDRILYFDCDVLIRQDLSPLWEMPLGGFACAGSDKAWAHDSRYCGQIGLSPSDAYVNAGVLLMSLRRFREQDLGRKLMDFARTATIKLPSMDQDVLNVVLRGQIATFPCLWNFTSYEFRNQRKAAKAAAVLHFTGSAKPWPTPGGRCRDWRGWLWRKTFLKLNLLVSQDKVTLQDRLRLCAVCCMERLARMFL